VLITDWTNVSWWVCNLLRTWLWASRQTLEIDSSWVEVQKAITDGTTIADTDTIRKRKGDGTYEEIPYLQIKNELSGSGKYVETVPLGETISGSTPTAMAIISSWFTTESVPTLTSNSGNPSYIVSSTHWSAWQAFDNNTTVVWVGSWQYWEIRIDMLAPVFMNSYSVWTGSSSTLYISTSNAWFWIQWSNDGASWTTLQTFSQDWSGNITPSSMPQQNTAYKSYKLYWTSSSWWASIYQWNFPFRYANQNWATPYTNTLGSNISGNRVKSGIRFSVPYNTALGVVKTSQVSTSASARVQLFQDDGTTLVTEQTPSSSDTVTFPDTPISANTAYRLVLNDNANFNNQSNELTLTSYQSWFRYAISGTLNGINTVEPQNIKEVQLGTIKAMKAVANAEAVYANLAGFVTWPKSKWDSVTLDANDGTLVSGFSWLTPLSKYYISNTFWAISTTAGTINRIVWLAVSPTELYLSSPFYPWTSITKP
jgi:hypothetical protein